MAARHAISPSFAIYEDPSAQGEVPPLIYEDNDHDEEGDDERNNEDGLSEPETPEDEEFSYMSDQTYDAADVPMDSIEKSPPSARKASSMFSSVNPSNPRATPRHRPQRSTSQSRRVSTLTTTSTVSSFPSSLHTETVVYDPYEKSSPFTPMRSRHVFRSPSSVRALQMDSPPPFDTRRGSADRKRHGTQDGSRVGTPVRLSIRSGSVMSAQERSRRGTPQRHTPQQQVQDKRQRPLVLLHITLLPPNPPPYPPHILAAVLPSHLLVNIDLLRVKATETVLSRGILIPHPRDDYELLEERLLESLELVESRILRCGHFFLEDRRAQESVHGDQVECDVNEDDGNTSVANSESTLRDDIHSHHRHLSADSALEGPAGDDVLCQVCQNQLKFASQGAGSGTRRWDVRFYAANGLMRAAAWGAAWNEMERVDVEVSAWIPEHFRRDMDRMMDEEEGERERVREFEEQEREREREEAAQAEALRVAEEEARKADLWRERRRAEGPHRGPGSTARPSLQNGERRTSGTIAANDIPLSTLLKNYFYLLVVSRRNIAIVVLSFLVIFLSFRIASTPGRSVAQALEISPHPVIRDDALPVRPPSVAETDVMGAMTKPSAIASSPDLVFQDSEADTVATMSPMDQVEQSENGSKLSSKGIARPLEECTSNLEIAGPDDTTEAPLPPSMN